MVYSPQPHLSHNSFFCSTSHQHLIFTSQVMRYQKQSQKIKVLIPTTSTIRNTMEVSEENIHVNITAQKVNSLCCPLISPEVHILFYSTSAECNQNLRLLSSFLTSVCHWIEDSKSKLSVPCSVSIWTLSSRLVFLCCISFTAVSIRF